MSDTYKSEKGEDAGVTIVNRKARKGLLEKLEEVRDQAVKLPGERPCQLEGSRSSKVLSWEVSW